MKKHLPLLCSAASSALFSFAFFFTIRATEAVGGDTIKLLSFRMLLASAIMTCLWKIGIIKMDFRGKPIKWLILAGIMSPILSFAVESGGLRVVPSSMFAAMYAATPIFATLFSMLVLKEFPPRRQIGFMLFSFIGVLVLNISPTMEVSLLSILLPFIAMSGGVVSQVFIKKATICGFSPIECVYFTMTQAGIVYTLVSIGASAKAGSLANYFDGVMTFQFLSSIAYLAIGCSITGFLLYYITISQLPIIVTSSFSALSTVMSIAIGVFMLHESFGVRQMVGVTLIIGGVMLMNMSYMRRSEVEDSCN